VNSKQEYQHVVGVVRYNTTPKQPPMIHRENVKVIASNHIGIDSDRVDSKLKKAVQNGDLIESNGRYVTIDDDRVERAISLVVDQVPVDQSLLGKLNKAKMQS